jgi:hypothetical protein
MGLRYAHVLGLTPSQLVSLNSSLVIRNLMIRQELLLFGLFLAENMSMLLPT